MLKNSSFWHISVPVIFVLLWSTGFIGAKLGLPFAEPMTFLFYRMLLTLVALYLIALVVKATWTCDIKKIGHISVSGLLVHAAYLGGLFTAIKYGLPAGLTALIVGLQPLLTTIVAVPFLGETVTKRQFLGLVLGLTGVAMVLGEKLYLNHSGLSTTSFGWEAVAFGVLALVGISLGTIYHKRYCTDMDLVSGTFIQYAATATALGIAAYFTEDMQVQWTGQFIFAMTWLVLVLSIGAITLLMLLIKRGEASKVSSLFYLVPPLTATEAYFLFDEKLYTVALVGMVITVIGVALVIIQGNKKLLPKGQELENECH